MNFGVMRVFLHITYKFAALCISVSSVSEQPCLVTCLMRSHPIPPQLRAKPEYFKLAAVPNIKMCKITKGTKQWMHWGSRGSQVMLQWQKWKKRTASCAYQLCKCWLTACRSLPADPCSAQHTGCKQLITAAPSSCDPQSHQQDVIRLQRRICSITRICVQVTS